VFNLSGSELIFLVLIALVVLGPDKLPEAMRKAGKAYADFKKMTNGFQSEMKSVLEEPMRELRETAELAKKSAMWDANDTSSSSNPGGVAAGSGPSTGTTANGTPAATRAAATPAIKPVSGSMAEHEPGQAARDRMAARAKAPDLSVSTNAPPMQSTPATSATPPEPGPEADAPATSGEPAVVDPATVQVVSTSISPAPIPLDDEASVAPNGSSDVSSNGARAEPDEVASA
jgi:Tat protein translocase TatB subunit